MKLKEKTGGSLDVNNLRYLYVLSHLEARGRARMKRRRGRCKYSGDGGEDDWKEMKTRVSRKVIRWRNSGKFLTTGFRKERGYL